MTAVAVASAFLTAGCLTGTYKIPHDDLMRIAQTPPAERGRDVRVVQNVLGQDEPPVGPRVESNTVIIVDGGGGDGNYGGGSQGGSGVRPGGGSGQSAKLAADDGKAWLIIGAIVAVTFAATEGARYDGYVSVHPMQHVHLYGPYGEYMHVPLAQLSPEQAAWASRAYIRDDEGPWQLAGQAPLDRVGFTYNFYLGGADVRSFDGDDERAYGGRLQFGFFPVQSVGILFDWGAYFRNNEQDLQVYSGRYGLELDLIPVTLGVLHLGGYGGVGYSHRIEDGGPENRDASGVALSGGGLAQLELTTRLTLTARAGRARAVDNDNEFEFALGQSIY
jgi:hypothetical protein